MASFTEACRQLGTALVESAQIVVGSDRPTTADKHVVEAYLSGAWKKHSIRVVSPKRDEAPFADLFRKHPEAFLYVSGSESTWRLTRPQVVSEVDAMITIGGGDGTYQVGQEIKLARKRLVPVAAFGGASSRLLRELLTSGGARQRDLLERLNNPWSRGLASDVMAVLGANEPSRVLLIHGHAQDRTILQDWLQAQDLAHPVVMAQEFTSGQTLPEKFESLATEVDAAIALVTPDDLASSVSQMDIKRQRARQNVWVEVGWFWGRLGRERILLLVRGDVEVPSDLDGIEYFSYEQSPLEPEPERKIRAFLFQVSERNQ
jgi:predicted nucleotide-binding protein